VKKDTKKKEEAEVEDGIGGRSGKKTENEEKRRWRTGRRRKWKQKRVRKRKTKGDKRATTNKEACPGISLTRIFHTKIFSTCVLFAFCS